MRIGCFAFALALVASAFTVEAWSPPYQTQRLYYVLGSGLRSNSTMSLDGVGAFTIRFTGLKFDWQRLRPAIPHEDPGWFRRLDDRIHR